MKNNVVVYEKQEIEIYYTYCIMTLTRLLNIMGEMGLHRNFSITAIHMPLAKM